VRAVDAEGEVLDVLVQAKRNKRAAQKLMELRRIFGDGVNQAADLVSGATSIPSRNLTPLMTFGN
jgi:transposase-like protein